MNAGKENTVNRLAMACLVLVALVWQVPCTSKGADSDQATLAERRAIMPQKNSKLFPDYCFERHEAPSEQEGFKQGQHLVMDDAKTPLCNLWLSTLRGIGIHANSVGDANSIVKELI